MNPNGQFHLQPLNTKFKVSGIWSGTRGKIFSVKGPVNISVLISFVTQNTGLNVELQQW